MIPHLEELVGWWSHTTIEYDIVESYKRLCFNCPTRHIKKGHTRIIRFECYQTIPFYLIVDAIKYGQISILKIFHTHNVKINFYDAVRMKKYRVCKWIARNCVLDEYDLETSAQENSLFGVRLCIRHGVKPTRRAFRTATFKGHIDIAIYLYPKCLKHGVQINIPDDLFGMHQMDHYIMKHLLSTQSTQSTHSR